MTKEEFEKKAEESCPDCFCEDCAKDCEIKKLGLVKTREITDFEKMYRELKEVWLKASFTEEERQLLACALSEWIRANESDKVMVSNIVLAKDLFRRIIGERNFEPKDEFDKAVIEECEKNGIDLSDAKIFDEVEWK
jgi:hypothetical protein